MGALPAAPKMTVAEYLIVDEKAERPSEYHDGELFPIVDASVNHAAIIANVAHEAKRKLADSPCRTFVTPRVRASARNFVLPDVAIVCGPVERALESQDAIVNPRVVLEILSPSTADFDYGGKFALYRGLSSLQEYVLIAQNQPLIEIFRKTPEGNWTLFSYRGVDTVLRLQTLNIEIPLNQIYADIEFPATESLDA
jgi:Uma2 family endonuclease